jgi:hypothetical protein
MMRRQETQTVVKRMRRRVFAFRRSRMHASASPLAAKLQSTVTSRCALRASRRARRLGAFPDTGTPAGRGRGGPAIPVVCAEAKR